MTSALLTQYKTVDPEFPGIDLKERLKLIKLSRSCSKKNIERFFSLDADSLVYY